MNQRLTRATLPFRAVAMAVLIIMSCALASCGADQVAGIEGSGAPSPASAVTATGPITGFGSIIADGVEYQTSAAQIRVDDQAAAESDLRVGQVITLKGTINADGTAGTAREVSFVSDARGPVSQVDIASGSFVVLGQTVKVDPSTLFDEALQAREVSELETGTKVRVSGFVGGSGALLASRIDSADAAMSADLQVRGKIQSLDTVAHTLRVNALTVDYGGAAISGTLANGSVAVVRGVAVLANGTLVATQVSVAGSAAGASKEKGQVEGLIATFTSNTDFVVGGQRIATDASTQFVLHGITLGADVFVKVRGTFDAAGVLVASRVEAKEISLGMVRGLVDSVSTANGTLVILGVTGTVSASTTFEDRSAEHKRQFRLGDVRVGDYVEMRGPASGATALSATLVQRDKPETRSYLRGIANDVVQPGFTTLGVAVITNTGTRFVGIGGGAQSATEFFNQAANQIVSVRGTLTGTTLVADRIRIEK